jgi:hypothetical protein
MNETARTMETRFVQDFDQVVLRDHFGGSELRITQGSSESLTIEANRDILPRIHSKVIEGKLILRVGGKWLERFNDMLSTSHSRPRIIYRLMVKELHGLEIFGAALIQASDLKSNVLAIKLRGAAKIHIQSLNVESLKLFSEGAGEIGIEGQANKQYVKVGGVGSYDGGRLKSKNVHIELRGTGRIVVQVEEELHLRVNGLGTIKYYGNPRVMKHDSGLGSIIHHAGV